MICILLLCLVSRIFGDSIDHIRDENIETEIKGEKFEFQAEISRLMDIIINSLYTDKTVFVRELVSNAADALEKSRYASLTDKEAKPEELSAKVEVDVDSKTFTILDNGVGMTRKDLIENLGTVARSGTANFLKNFVGEGGNLDLSLIGQFGVGFYSAFLVADKVTVTSKNDLDKHQHIWQSSIGGGFTIAEDPRGNTLGRGTRITLHLKDDSLEFTNSTVVTDLIMRYNQYVNFPIYVLTPQKKASVKPSTSPEKQDEVDENDEAEEDADDDLSSIDEESSTVLEWVHVNTFKPIWLRPKDTISPEEYLEFYKGLTKDYGKPLNWTHFNAEGEIDFTSILYIPSSSHSNPFGNYFSDKQESLKLYSKRVLIADVLSDVLPKWLGFIRGVVDSDDLPLKVDRENVSQQRVYKTISKKIVGKALDMMKQMSQDDTEAWIAFKNQNTTPPKTPYHEFWDKFGKNLKIGCSEEKNRGRIAKLLRFQSSSLNETDWTSFDEYVKRMKDSNRRKEEILFISNEYYGSAMNSPHMARYVKDNIEVLILTDPLDENCFDSLQKYEDIPLVSVEKSSMFDDPSTDDEKKMKMIKKAFEPLTKALSSQLNEHVQSVRITTKLVHDPAVVTATSFGPSAFADRVARSHTLSKHSDVYSKYQRFLDINPSHPLIKKMLLMVKNEEDIADLSNSIMDAALLGSGFVVNDPSRIARQYLSLVQERVGIAEDEVVAEYVLSEEETLAFEDTTPVADFDGHDEL